jgi:glucose-6-phosphate isomerase
MAALSKTPIELRVDPRSGALANATATYGKRLADLRGVHLDGAAFDLLLAERGDRLAYEVHSRRAEERPGDLAVGTTVLFPGRVGREYAMTRGHAHRLADRAEVYYCLTGHGVLLTQPVGGAEDGDAGDAVELRPGTVAYVPPHHAHRSVNVGDEPLVILFCYPADAGQDYEVVERSGGFRRLVVDDARGGWRTVDNPRWRPFDGRRADG